MDIYQIATIILALSTVIGGISITTFLVRGKKIKDAAIQFVEEYKVAMSDGVLSDTEKAALMDCVVVIVDESLSLYQAFVNIIAKIKDIFSSKQ